MFLCFAEGVFLRRSDRSRSARSARRARRGRSGSLFFAVAVAISAKANSCSLSLSLSPSLWANQCCVAACACVSFIFRWRARQSACSARCDALCWRSSISGRGE